MTTLEEDIDPIVSITRHEPFRKLVNPEHPEHFQADATRYLRALAKSYRTNSPIELDPPPSSPQNVPVSPASIRDTAPPIPLDVTIPHEEWQAILAKMRSCVHWERSPTCCGPNHCDLGKGRTPGEVNPPDCHTCIKDNAGFSPRDKITSEQLLQLPPPSEKRPMPIVDNPQTIGDLANNVAAYKAILTDDTTALTAAQAKVVTDTAAATDSNTAFGAALAKLGKSYGIDNGDGTGTVYRSDGNGGFIPEAVVFGSVPIPS